MAADYDARTAVERELVLRLAALLWRLRRSIAIETDLLQSQAEAIRDERKELRPEHCEPSPICPRNPVLSVGRDSAYNHTDPLRSQYRQLAHSFLRFTNVAGGAFELLNRYEARLWRQAVQTLMVLQSIRLR